MGLGGILLIVIFIGGAIGCLINELITELVDFLKKKFSDKTEVKKRREFKPGVLGKYEP